ncbi:hypothetical protein LJR231_002266 [Phyllobacterium sp. LjRoot231]|uniref:hypothetical protein n=1 Tax=Phyllobacterium sp. LjRoot231 TaxID=3342289 RepID=UPI003ED108EE
MELATAAFGALFGSSGLAAAGATAGAGAATAGAGAAAAGGLASASSGVLSVLQGVSATLGILGKIGAGNAAADASNQQADQAELESSQEQLKQTQRQTVMKRELARVLGENDVTFAAAGIDLSSGIAQSAAANATKRATDEISVDRADSDFRRALLKQRASGFRSQARSSRTAGLLGALETGAGYGIDLAKRG